MQQTNTKKTTAINKFVLEAFYNVAADRSYNKLHFRIGFSYLSPELQAVLEDKKAEHDTVILNLSVKAARDINIGDEVFTAGILVNGRHVDLVIPYHAFFTVFLDYQDGTQMEEAFPGFDMAMFMNYHAQDNQLFKEQVQVGFLTSDIAIEILAKLGYPDVAHEDVRDKLIELYPDGFSQEFIDLMNTYTKRVVEKDGKSMAIYTSDAMASVVEKAIAPDKPAPKGPPKLTVIKGGKV